MQVTIDKLPQSEVKLTVEVGVADIDSALQKAAVRLSEKVSIPGFRPGKVPYDIVRQKYGEMAILQEAIDDIIAATFYQAVTEHQLITVGAPQISVEKMAPGNPIVYTATVAILPEVTIGDYTQISLQREPVVASAEEVTTVIEDLRRYQATETLVDRPAETHDKVEVNFEVFLDNVPVEGGSHQKYPVTIGEQRFIPGFEEQLVGITAGAEKEFQLPFPDDYYNKQLAGKTADFKVKCNGVFQINLPELTAEFAASISSGKFATIEDLRASVERNLLDEHRQRQEQRLELQMLEKLIEISSYGDLPESLVHNEVHKMLHEIEDSVGRQGMKMDDYLTVMKKTRETLEAELRPQAEQRVKTAILTRQIARQQNIVVGPDEVDAEAEAILANYPDNEQARQQVTNETYKDYIRHTLANRKVLELLKGQIIKEAPLAS